MSTSLSPSTTPKGQDVSPQGGVVARGMVTFNHAQLGDDDPESYSARDGTTTNATENTTALGVLKAIMFDDLRHPKDTILDTQRKIVVAWGLPLALLPIAFLFYLLVEMTAAAGPTAGTVVAATAMLLFVGAWIPINVLVRFRRRLSELMVDVWLFVTLVGLLTLSISLVEYPVAITSFFLAALVFLCDTPRKPFHLVGCALVYILAVTNQAIAGLSRDADGRLGTLPDGYWSSTQERFVFQGSTLIIAAVVTASLQMQANERSRNALSEVAAARFARRVADQLICCNTDAAVEELRALRVQAYTEEGEYVKPQPQPQPSRHHQHNSRGDRQGAPPRLGELVSPGVSVTSMPENSRFAGTVDSIDLSADSAQIQIGSARHADLGTPVAADAATAAGDAQKPTKKEEEEAPAILVSVDHRLIESFELLINHFEQFRPHLPSWLLSTAVHQGDRVAGAHLREATDADMVSIEESIILSESNSASNTPNSRSPRQASYRLAASQQRTLGALSLGQGGVPRSPLNQRLSTHSNGSNDGMSGHRGKACKIAVAWIDVTRAVAPDPAHPTVQDAVCALVDSVHEAADNTYASVHSFIGDSILASWNTGRHCANVESKAARFMAAVRDATLMHDGLSLHATGAVMTGDAFVQLAGHSGRQLALTAWFTPWRAALRQLASFSRSCGGLLLDEVTSVASSFSVETRIVDYVTVSRTSSGYASNRASPSPSPLAPRFSFGVVTSETPLSLHRPSQLCMPEIQSGCRTFPVFEVIRDTNYQNTRERRTMMAHTPTYLERPEEWMYTVGNAEKASSTAMREALTQAQSGRFADARDLLEAALRKEAAQRAASRSPGSNPSSFGTSHSEKDVTPRAAGGPAGGARAAGTAHGAASGSGGMRREHSGGQLPPLHTGSGVGGGSGGSSGAAAAAGGSAGSDGGIHLASATLPPSTPPLARRLLYKLETFAAMGDAACWAAFPDDLTKYI